MKRWYRSALILLSFLSAAAVPRYFSHQIGNEIPAETLPDIIKRIQPSIVNVQTDRSYSFGYFSAYSFTAQFFSDFFESDETRGGEVKLEGEGTGIILDASGVILTNEHVISNAKTIRVILSDKKIVTAVVIGKNKKEDLALLKIESGTPLQAIPQGDSDAVKPGEDVFAIGTPYGYSQTVTKGIVSAVNRDLVEGNRVILEGLIQTDAALNPGNSGGPLLNSKGEMIGVVQGGDLRGQNISFVIPISKVKKILPELQTPSSQNLELEQFRKKFGFLPEASKDKDGREIVLISEIEPSSKISKMGLKPEDRLYKFQTIRIESLEQLLEEVRKVSAGQRSYFEFERQKRVFFTYIEAGT